MRQCLICGNRFVPWRDEKVFCTPCVETHTGAELDAIKQANARMQDTTMLELLAALEVIVKVDDDGREDEPFVYDNMMRQARAAIAKAKGGNVNAEGAVSEPQHTPGPWDRMRRGQCERSQ